MATSTSAGSTAGGLFGPPVATPRDDGTGRPVQDGTVPQSIWSGTTVDPATGNSGVPLAGGGTSTDWQRTGGNNTTDVYTNSKTGQVTLISRDTGQVQGQYTAEEWAKENERNGVLSPGEIQEGTRDIFNGVPKDPLGTPTLGGSDNPADLLGGINKFGKDNTLINVGSNGSGVSPGNLLGGGGSGLPGDATANIQAAIAQQNALVQQNTDRLNNYQNIAAPTAAGPGSINAALANQVDPIQAAIAQAQQAQAATIGNTALAGNQAAITPEQVQAAMVQGTRVGPVTNANAAQIDLAQQAQMREAQQGLISGLQGAISGKEPSVAEIMLRNATDRNVANQYALAQAANGMNTGLAQRSAMINAAELNSNAVMQQALLRAQEITAARGQLGGVLDSARGADIGLATSQAGLTQAANLQNAGAANTANLTQAQINAQRAQEQAQLAQAASVANQGANLQGATTNATLAQQVALANAAAQNTTSQQNAKNAQEAALQNAQLGTQTNIANAGNQTQAATQSAQLANAVNLANANNQSQANTAAAQLNTQANIANANNQVSTNTLNQKAQQDLAANQLTGAGQAGQTAIGQGDVYAKLADAEAKKQAALIGGAAAAGAALLSDRREKIDVSPVEAEIAGWTSTLTPYKFRYKEPEKPGAQKGQRFGIMAQDLERSRIGRSLVREREDGTKEVDVPQSVGAILATLSAMNRRLDRAGA